MRCCGCLVFGNTLGHGYCTVMGGCEVRGVDGALQNMAWWCAVGHVWIDVPCGGEHHGVGRSCFRVVAHADRRQTCFNDG